MSGPSDILSRLVRASAYVQTMEVWFLFFSVFRVSRAALRLRDARNELSRAIREQKPSDGSSPATVESPSPEGTPPSMDSPA